MKKIVCLFVCLFAGVANALVIDFEEINNPNHVYSGNSLDSQGFNFFNTAASPAYAILHWGKTSTYNADQDGVTYSHNFSNTVSTLTKIGGGIFDLTSIDFGDVYNHGSAQNLLVTGYYQAGGSTQSAITTDALSGLETFTFGWAGLSSATWTETSGSYLQLDNV